MVAQFDPPDDSHDPDDARRFPVQAPGLSPSELILQIQLDPDVIRDVPSIAQLIDTLSRDVVEGAASPLGQIRTALREFGATGIEPAFDWTSLDLSDILTPEEQQRRRGFFDVTFRPGTNLTDLAVRLRSLPFILQAVPLPDEAPPYADEPLLGTDDQNLDRQWYIFRVRADRAWRLATGRDVVVADIDFGFNVCHEDLSNVERGKAYNSHDGSSDVGQGRHIGHGTAVLGFVGAARNGRGVSGIAFDAAMWPIQANTGGKRIPGDKWARGIDYVLATSSGGRRKIAMLEVQTGRGRCYEMRPSTNEAVRQAIAHGLIMVVAAGNGAANVELDDNDKPYPETGSILVGATVFHPDHNLLACFSNFGSRLTVSAPGYPASDFTCGKPGNSDYRKTFGGTSGATPKVAAACALMLQVNAGLSHHDVRQILIKTGTDVLSPPEKPGGSFLNVVRAVKMAK
jgi:subtilisin family serine protease